MAANLKNFVMESAARFLADDSHGDDHAHGFGVHIKYEDLYNGILFLACIYVAGQVASRLFTMPPLVGEIICGIIMGPPAIDFVPNPTAWVLLGEIGLVLLVLEAGIDIDVSTLKLIGTRGFLIAVVGSVLPIGLGIAIALVLNGTGDIKAALAAGASFGPTSLGIALNILRGGGILNTPVGQMIISAAVIDDMIALFVLSQLESLAGTITVSSVLIPVISAVGFLVLGGYVALFIVPPIMEAHVLKYFPTEEHGRIEMAVMVALLLGMMPATYYGRASYLMGAFVAGLAFCTSHELHVTFVQQFKRLMQWLMRVFFAASIGFQVPIKDFANGTVIWQGLVYTLALTGKLAVGFMVPNFTQSASFTEFHLRDCLITGFSMAAEGEFAFVIAVFAVDVGLIDKDLYASIILAVLLSTIFPPFALRFTISYYHKKSEAMIEQIAHEEMNLHHQLGSASEKMSSTDRNEALAGEIRGERAVFLCLQTQSLGRWGLMHELMSTMASLGLDVIDHRAWHPRGIETTLVNEVYAKTSISLGDEKTPEELLEEKLKLVEEKVRSVVGEDAKVKVQRWYPGVVQEIIESHEDKSKVRKSETKLSLEQRLLSEAAAKLDHRQSLQLNATKEKTVEEILQSMGEGQPSTAKNEVVLPASGGEASLKSSTTRRRRQKMRSTPVVGGDMFGEMTRGREANSEEEKSPDVAGVKDLQDAKALKVRKRIKPTFEFGPKTGHRAEIIVNGESYDVRINDTTIKALQTGYSGDMLDSRGVSVGGLSITPDSSSVGSQLSGYVRNAGLQRIMEEDDAQSETSSVSGKTSTVATEKKLSANSDEMV